MQNSTTNNDRSHKLKVYLWRRVCVCGLSYHCVYSTDGLWSCTWELFIFNWWPVKLYLRIIYTIQFYTMTHLSCMCVQVCSYFVTVQQLSHLSVSVPLISIHVTSNSKVIFYSWFNNKRINLHSNKKNNFYLSNLILV